MMVLLFFFVGAESVSLVMFIRIRGQWRHEAKDGRTQVIRSIFVTALIMTVINWYIYSVVLIHFNGFVPVHYFLHHAQRHRGSALFGGLVRSFDV